MWACVIPDIENPFFTSMVRGVEDVARPLRYSVVLANTDEDPATEADYLQMVVAQRMAGVIISPTRQSTDVSHLQQAGIQVVCVDREVSQPTDAVLVNSAAAARQATEHLIAAGCTRIACVTGRADTTVGAERLRGYREALLAAGRRLDGQARAPLRLPRGVGARRDVLAAAAARAPDGIFVANNQMTLGVLRALQEAGQRVPQDVAVAGFDDLPWWALSAPTVTAVAQPTYQMGRAAGEMLAARLAGDRQPPRARYLDAVLVRRQSSRLGGVVDAPDLALPPLPVTAGFAPSTTPSTTSSATPSTTGAPHAR
ncbi:LacI family transcriptional regulator [Angustibacter aerolatus]|uniref:LacI family transcriptional regulator n=1 Tax=Angustibacter aerolatus TaxID=1162965 RepID=A0ABQ6JC45_9ACTN|nr:LacI family transcriptional regulator [Angustibacter aerolatus]